MAYDRTTMLEGFARVLNDDALATLDALVPTRPWREAIPSSFWLQSSVMAATDERARRDLHERLITVIGADAAHATMEYLSPVLPRVRRQAR